MKGLIISVIVLLAVFGQHSSLSASAEKSLKDGQQNADLKASPLKLLDSAVRLAEREHHSAIKAELLSSLAIVYLRLGEKKKGEDLLARSRQLIEEEDDLSKDCYECPSKEF